MQIGYFYHLLERYCSSHTRKACCQLHNLHWCSKLTKVTYRPDMLSLLKSKLAIQSSLLEKGHFPVIWKRSLVSWALMLHISFLMLFILMWQDHLLFYNRKIKSSYSQFPYSTSPANPTQSLYMCLKVFFQFSSWTKILAPYREKNISTYDGWFLNLFLLFCNVFGEALCFQGQGYSLYSLKLIYHLA